MKFSNLGLAVLSASTASSAYASFKPQDVNCTHMILGGAKSKTTAVARTLCHALQQQGHASCIHEPVRMLHEESNWQPHQWRSPRFKSSDTSLCKDMLYQSDASIAYKERLSKAIEKTENPIVFIKGNPVNSFLSIVSLNLGFLNEHFNFKLKEKLSSKESVDKFAKQMLNTVAKEIVGTAKAYLEMADVAENAGKKVVKILDEDLISQPKEELNKILSSWGKQEIAGEHEMTMSTVIDWSSSRVVPANIESSYQLGVRDPWDTVKGDVFAPSEVSSSTGDRIEAMVKKYVPEHMAPYFSKVLNFYCDKITSKIQKMDSDHAAAQSDQRSSEL